LDKISFESLIPVLLAKTLLRDLLGGDERGATESTFLVLAIIVVLIGGGLVLYFLTITSSGVLTTTYP